MGFQEVAGYYNSLQKGLKEFGIESVFVNLDKNPFRYGVGGTEPALVRLVRHSAERRFATARWKLLPKLWWFTVHQLSYVCMFYWAVAKFDVFIFGFLTSFYNYRELRLLKALGKKIVYVFHGSDSRPHYLNGFGSEALPAAELVRQTRQQKQDIRRIERYADVIVCNPLSAHLHERPYLAYQIIGVPFSTDTARFAPPARVSPGVRILHAPSQQSGKGSAQIRAAIESLRRKGRVIDFVEMTGKPHTGVLEELQLCDFVVDQLYSDTPMAHFTREAAFYGKPAVVGGYGAREFHRCCRADQIPPTLYCRPEELEAAIDRLIVDESYRRELGARAKEFVDAHWSARMVAERFIRAVQGHIDPSWEFYPDDVQYLQGCGLSDAQARQLVQKAIGDAGITALQAGDKPDLEASLLEFAQRRNEPATPVGAAAR